MDKNFAHVPIDIARIHRKLDFAEQLLQGIASATQELLTSNNFDQSIQNALSILGEATLVDRVYIFKQHFDIQKTPLVSQCWEWVTKGINPEIDNPDLQNLPIKELFPRWYRNINQNKSISGWVKDFPASERAILDPQNILSLVVVPIHVNHKIWGFMGFDDCHEGHDWTGSEVAALKSVANAFGGAFASNKMSQQLLLNANQDLLAKQFKLTQQKVRADRANQAKQVLLANISHELKTPLNGILGYSQILKKSTNLSIENQIGLNKIHQSANHLNLLVNNLLDITELESKELTIDFQKVNFLELLKEIEDIAIIHSNAKSLSFQVETSPQIPQYVWIDDTRIKQVLLNLIKNSVKFTTKGSIKLKIIQLPSIQDWMQDTHETDIYQHAFRFIVEDTGIGMSTQEQENIFSLFSKVANRNNNSEGAGLGLFISQKIIRALGSEIQVNSIYGKGSEFFFDIILECLGEVSFKKPTYCSGGSV